MRILLDRLYGLSLWLSALCIVAIAVLVGLQIGGRIFDSLLKLFGYPPYGFVILSLSEIAGYLMAAGGFLGLAATLKSGAHIRVTLVLGRLPEQVRTVFEASAALAGASFCGYVAWFVSKLAIDSFRFNELSPGLIPVQLGYPQAAMAIGAIMLTVAILDEFVIIITRGQPSFRAAEDAVTLGKEG